MEAAATTEPVKRRGRPKKVAEEGQAEGKKSVRQASTKTAASPKSVGKKEEAPKKAARGTTTKATKMASATPTTAKTTAAKSTRSAEAKSAAEEPKATPAASARVEKKATPVTLSSSKILQEVYEKGMLKMPAAERIQSAAQPAYTPQPSSSSQVQTKPVGPIPSASKPIPPPTSPHPAAKPTAPPTPKPTTSSPPPTNPPPAPASTPKPHPPRTTTILLPRHPQNPFNLSTPAPSRPKPPTPEALAQQATERAIREGKVPPKYKPAARRVTAIMVGIPVIVVVGYELYKRYDRTIRTKFDVKGVGKPSA